MSQSISELTKQAQKIREQGQRELLKQLKQKRPSEVHTLDATQIARLSPEQRQELFTHIAKSYVSPKANQNRIKPYQKQGWPRRLWLRLPVLIRSQVAGLLAASLLLSLSAYALSHEHAIRTSSFAYSVFYGGSQ